MFLHGCWGRHFVGTDWSTTSYQQYLISAVKRSVLVRSFFNEPTLVFAWISDLSRGVSINLFVCLLCLGTQESVRCLFINCGVSHFMSRAASWRSTFSVMDTLSTISRRIYTFLWCNNWWLHCLLRLINIFHYHLWQSIFCGVPCFRFFLLIFLFLYLFPTH